MTPRTTEAININSWLMAESFSEKTEVCGNEFHHRSAWAGQSIQLSFEVMAATKTPLRQFLAGIKKLDRTLNPHYFRS